VARTPARHDAPAPGDAIEAALRDLAARLEAHEVIEAAVAAQRLGDAVSAANTGPSARIDEVTRARLAPLVERCTALAAKSNAKLAAALAAFGIGKRAHRAYSSAE
jgi:hypothetical protein